MTNLEKWRFRLKDVESPNSYIDWSFWFVISSALQRRVWFGHKEDPLHFNQYIFLVGPPATGKGRVIKPVNTLLRANKLNPDKAADDELLFPALRSTNCEQFEYCPCHLR